MSEATAFVLTHESDPRRTQPSMSMIALAITRSLGRRGVPVVRVHPNRLDRSLVSKYCTAVEISPDFYASEGQLLAFLLTLPERYAGPRVLIPASDDCAYFVAKYHAELSRRFAVIAPDMAVMDSILDKRRQYETAQRLGVPIPETYFPADLDDVRNLLPSLLNYPYVIKPLVAHAWRQASMSGVSQGKKGFAVHNAEELLSRYEAIAHGDKNVMIQEVIGGRDEALFTFLSYFNEDAEPVAYCIRKKLRQLPVDFGYCTATVSCHDEVVKEQSIRLLRGLSFHGISGVEWKLDPRTGIYKLIEVNPRAVNTTALAAACGVDLPYLAFCDKLGASAPPITEWTDGVKWINFELDIWAARELKHQGKLTWREWWQSIRGPKIDAIFALDDLRPFTDDLPKFLKTLLLRLRRGSSKLFRPRPKDMVAGSFTAAPGRSPLRHP